MPARTSTFFSELPDLPLLFYYQGNYSEGPSAYIAKILEHNIKRSGKTAQLKKLLYLIIEALQNIERYSGDYKSGKDHSLVYSDRDHYYILTQNTIVPDKADELRKRLDELNSKSADELRDVYMNRLMGEEKTEKGVGLGLIEITRKTNKNIIYRFEETGNKNLLYTLGFAIPTDEHKGGDAADFRQAEALSALLSRYFSENNRTLFYHGDFSNAFLRILLSMLKIMQNEKKSLDRRTHHILIELIQNINRHGLANMDLIDAKLLIEWRNNEMEISSFNQSSRENFKALCQKIELLNRCGKEDLERLGQQLLGDLESTNGLGLIDIANLIFPEKIVHDTKEYDEKTEITLNLTVKNG